MEIKHKCNYCDALLSETNSVFVHINRFDKRGKSSRSLWMCCKCWDNTEIKEPYYHLDHLPDPECTVKFKDNPHICGNCKHLIFKDYRHNDGTCGFTHRIKSFYDYCDKEKNYD